MGLYPEVQNEALLDDGIQKQVRYLFAEDDLWITQEWGTE